MFTLAFKSFCSCTIWRSNAFAAYSSHNVLILSLSVSSFFRFMNTLSASATCFEIASIFTADSHGCPCLPRYAILCLSLSRSSDVFLMSSLDCSCCISPESVSIWVCMLLWFLKNSSCSLDCCMYSAWVNAMSCPT